MAKITMSNTPTNGPFTRQTCSGRRFKHNATRMGYSEHLIFASITHSQSGQVLLHSLAAAAATSPPVLLGFENNLKRYGNETLWESLDYDGDGLWILEGMINRSLIIIHDGSYMKETSPLISAAAMILTYSSTTLPTIKTTISSSRAYPSTP